MSSTNDPKLERYLSALESALKPFPVSDRAEVITEIKSHVLSAMEKDPQARMDNVLAALGEPETVANRYLMDRGLKTTKPPISPVVKWVVVGFLSTFAMLLIFLGFLLSQFSPLVRVTDNGDKVTLLGGLIQVNDKNGDVEIKGFGGDSGNKREIAGSIDVASGESVHVRFGTGRVNVGNSGDGKFSWDCRTDSKESLAPPTPAGGQLLLDFSKLGGVKCELMVPQKAPFVIEGTTGKIDLAQVKFNADVALETGKVVISPDEHQAYHYDLNVSVGRVADQDSLHSSDAADALKIRVHVGTGKIAAD